MRSHSNACLGVLSLLCAFLAPHRAAAADPPLRPGERAVPPPEPDEGGRAAQWLSRGNKAFKEGRFADAEQAYREAFALKRGYDVAGNLGAAELAQGKRREAAQHLAFTLRLFPITGDPGLRAQMEKAYEQCRAEVGAVHVEVEPKGAQILVDGVAQGEGPLADDVFLEPGEHRVEATLDGFTAALRRVSVEKGVAAAVQLTLVPVPEPPPRVIVREVPPRRRSLVPGLALGAAAVVGIAGGAAFLGLEASRKSSAQATRGMILSRGGSCVGGAANQDASGCGTLQSRLKADDAFHDVAVGAFVVGGLAAAGTAAYFLWPVRRPSMGRTTGPNLQVTPVFGADSGGAMVTGSF